MKLWSAVFSVLLLPVLLLRSTQAASLSECCLLATSDICNSTCVEVLSEFTASSLATLSSTEIQALSSACSPTYQSSFWLCINGGVDQHNYTTEDVTTEPNRPPSGSLQEYNACCSMSESENCRDTCSAALLMFNGDLTAVFSNIIGDCGLPPEDPVWHCLLAFPDPESPTDVAVPTEIPVPPNVDWARVQCCYRAKAAVCKDSCLDLYSGQVSSTSWSTVQLDCIHRPEENSLSTCLADVASPCQLGCSGMQFCRNFNNRPSQSFRQCTTTADRLAKNSYYSWIHNGRIVHPLVTLLVGNVAECLPEAWKTVACITQLQPCHSSTHATQICRGDCIRLLAQCTNSSVISETICNIIAPASSEGRCISVDQFLRPSRYGNDIIPPFSLDNPCDPNPCAEGFFCSINRLCTSEDQSCTPYNCQPGCVVGTKPSIVLPKSGGVRVSLVSHSRRRCHGYLNCSSTADSSLSDDGTDVNTGPSILNRNCEREQGCLLQDGTPQEHHSNFWVDCNFCTCYYGRITCTNYTCVGNISSVTDCGCGNEYEPVCTRNGVTISNRCRAQCFGYDDYHSGHCGSFQTCSNSGLCGVGSKCIPQRHSCLSNSTTQCPQFKCESLDQEACLQQTNPVCDIFNNQHNSLCSFLRTQEDFNYIGYCKSECSSSSSPVCGVNGETFATECHAHNAYVHVDYYSSCQSSPQDGPDGRSCRDVNCPDLSHANCRSVVPWGACCPLCGTVITVLMDKVILQRNIQSLRISSFSSIDIIRRLQFYISYTQCELFGHVAADSSLFLIVVPKKDAALTNLVVEVCHQEAVKLATFINNQTPILALDPFLSQFIAAHVSDSIIREDPPTEVNIKVTLPNHSMNLIPNILIDLLFILFSLF